MKGTHFKQPLEYKIEIAGESWKQGSNVQGTLEVKCHSGEDISISRLGVQLSYCTKKKLKEKDLAGISEIESSLRSGDSTSLDFNFTLSEKCPITEKSKSLYLIYGDLDNPFDSGFLEIEVTPSKTITDFIQTFEQFFRFKLKTLKMKKNVIEAIATPPASKDWTSIQKMSLQFSMEGDTLLVNFIFSLKKMSFDSSVEKTKDEKREVSLSIGKSEYERYGTFNQEAIQKMISDVLEQIRVKPLL